jgi:hypothetical protein
VPMIMQWKGVIPAETHSNYFSGHTDLLPTFLQVARIAKPADLKVDGLSILSVLLKGTKTRAISPDTNNNNNNNNNNNLKQQLQHVPKHVGGEKEIRARYFKHNGGNGDHGNTANEHRENGTASESWTQANEEEAQDRVFLWHKDTDPYSRDHERVQSAGYYDFVKVLSSSSRGCIDRIFDLRHDPLEKVNLLSAQFTQGCRLHFQNVRLDAIANALQSAPVRPHCLLAAATDTESLPAQSQVDSLTESNCHAKYRKMLATKVWIVLKKLIPFVKYGNRGHLKYLERDAKNATCAIPITADVFRLQYDAAAECHRDGRFGCSGPEY